MTFQPSSTGNVQPGQLLLEGKDSVEPYQPTDLFLEQKVHNFRNSDFALDSEVPIALRYKDSILMLFYNDLNREDRDMAGIWQSVARLGVIGTFGAVNLRTEIEVNEAINKVRTQSYDFAPRSIPEIIIYQKHFPQAFYNGPREINAIVDYVLALACDANYHRRIHATGLQIHGNKSPLEPRNPTNLILGQGIRRYGRYLGKTPIEKAKRNLTSVPDSTDIALEAE